MTRKHLPADLKRAVLMESGFRCAIPACRQDNPEVHHITPISEGGPDSFHNLIALCPNCHARYHRGEIDRKAMRIYKANLAIVNGRYSSLERRVLEHFGQRPDTNDILLPRVLEILYECLLTDGLLQDPEPEPTIREILEPPTHKRYIITSKGHEFVRLWFSGHELR